MPKGNGKPITKVEVIKEISSGLIEILHSRFEENISRHKSISWEEVEQKLKNNSKLQSINAMEATGGEPDVIGYDEKTNEYIFCDCSKETPNRRSICYDQAGEEARIKKGINPGGNAVGLAHKMGIELLNVDEYKRLQEVGSFDTKTSSWLKTPDNIRTLGGAIFGDKRYGTVFIYHNGAESFYGSRGFRGMVRV